ncbi:MAG TPA: glycosyltransferase family 4 protein [Candidatus Didemnitutus sp.]|nr:glycosyltransferase family 4 protein [Candidatus Didemnitutus sp.]
MKLLVLAQTPPPVHGQSLMVQTAVEGLPAHGIELEHVALPLSRSAADIGRWHFGKLLRTFDACFHAIAARFVSGCDVLYYVPAPAKRGALYRDWAVMLLCRPFFKKLVLHWHAAGLGEWLQTRATAPERWLTKLALGRADLALVLAGSLRSDAEILAAKKIAIVPNGVADPGAPTKSLRGEAAAWRVLFLGLGSEEKGLFLVADAVLAANAQTGGNHFQLVAAGSWASDADARRFAALAGSQRDVLQHVGFVTGDAKDRLLRTSDCLVLPSRFPHEAQPLVLLEALAYDLPVIASRWRGIPETLPTDASILVPPGDITALTTALIKLRRSPPTAGVARRHFVAHYTKQRHVEQLARALQEL